MVRKPVTFLNTEYKTQGEFGKFVEKFIADIGICNDIKNVYNDKYGILIKILERHPNWNSKSENMRNIKIISNVLNRKALEIWIIKDDGEIDISWRCAITGKGKSKKNELMSAMRVSVREQTYNFRRNCGIYCCELCGNNENLEVDHNDEKNSAFDELAFNFIKENNVFIAEPEKAFIDAIYLMSLGRYKLDLSAIEFSRLDKERIKTILKSFPSKTREYLERYERI